MKLFALGKSIRRPPLCLAIAVGLVFALSFFLTRAQAQALVLDDFEEVASAPVGWTAYNNSTPVGTDTPTTTPSQTPTLTVTPTGTPTVTPQLDGASCTSGSECESTFCADGVCCNTACDGPAEVCSQEGSEGICARIPAPAPTMSDTGLSIVAVVLLAVGLLALLRRRRDLVNFLWSL